jgi:hypothetical protein
LRSRRGRPIGIVEHIRHNSPRAMSNRDITYLVATFLGVFGFTAFCALVLVPAITAYRRPLERVAVVILSLYVLAALVGIGVLLGALIVFEWPRVF